MSTQQKMSCLIAALVVVILLVGAPNSMAGAYDTGEGQGYASCASTDIMQNGTIFRFTRIQSDVCPPFYREIDQLRHTPLFYCAFRPVAYCLPGTKI